MVKQGNKMEKFEFLIGDWDLDYSLPENEFNKKAGTGKGSGTIRRILGNRYVCFDYSCLLTTGADVQAQGIFAWDDKANIYRYRWFESSGSFSKASCRFIDDDTLFLNWHDSLLIQTFRKDGADRVMLSMKHPDSHGEYQAVLSVRFDKR